MRISGRLILGATAFGLLVTATAFGAVQPAPARALGTVAACDTPSAGCAVDQISIPSGGGAGCLIQLAGICALPSTGGGQTASQCPGSGFTLVIPGCPSNGPAGSCTLNQIASGLCGNAAGGQGSSGGAPCISTSVATLGNCIAGASSGQCATAVQFSASASPCPQTASSTSSLPMNPLSQPAASLPQSQPSGAGNGPSSGSGIGGLAALAGAANSSTGLTSGSGNSSTGPASAGGSVNASGNSTSASSGASAGGSVNASGSSTSASSGASGDGSAGLAALGSLANASGSSTPASTSSSGASSDASGGASAGSGMDAIIAGASGITGAVGCEVLLVTQGEDPDQSKTLCQSLFDALPAGATFGPFLQCFFTGTQQSSAGGGSSTAGSAVVLQTCQAQVAPPQTGSSPSS